MAFSMSPIIRSFGWYADPDNWVEITTIINTDIKERTIYNNPSTYIRKVNKFGHNDYISTFVKKVIIINNQLVK